MKGNNEYSAKTEIGYIVEKFIRKEGIRMNIIPYRLMLACLKKEAQEKRRRQRLEAWRNG